MQDARRGRRQRAGLFASAFLLAAMWGCGTSQQTPIPKKNPALQVEPEQRRVQMKHFAIFRGGPEPLPLELTPQLQVIKGIRELSQRLPVIAPQSWAIPTSNGMCLVQWDRGGTAGFTCTRLGRALKEGIFIASVPASFPEGARTRSVVGVVPNGVHRVRIRAGNARPRTVTVVENVFALRDHSRAFPESIELIRGG
jgi:hypothetical protein